MSHTPTHDESRTYTHLYESHTYTHPYGSHTHTRRVRKHTHMSHTPIWVMHLYTTSHEPRLFCVTRGRVWHDASVCVTRCIHMCDTTHGNGARTSVRIHRQHTHGVCWYVRHGASVCVTRRIHVCDTTHSYAWHHSNGAREIARAHTNVVRVQMTCIVCWYVWHDPCVCETWLIHTPLPQQRSERDCTGTHTWFVCSWLALSRLTVETLWNWNSLFAK